MQADRHSFGRRLRLERERRGIALKDIAEATKIKESLFVELERGDFSKWPQGIFRRAHLCAYVSAIGLPSQPILAEFLSLFPDTSAQPSELADPQAPGDHPVPAPRTLAVTPLPTQPVFARAWILAFDVAAVCLISSFAAALTSAGLWSVIAFVGLGYFSLGSACVARTFGASVLHGIQARLQHSAPSQDVSATLAEGRLITSRVERSPVPVAVPAVDIEEETHLYDRRASA